MQLTPHFNSDEEGFACPCCGKADIDKNAINRLERARMYAGIPFKLNSAVRCVLHNSDVGGVDSSAHVKGYAFDIAVDNSQDRFIILWALAKAGFNRIGIANTFIHVDSSPTKPPDVVWVY